MPRVANDARQEGATGAPPAASTRATSLRAGPARTSSRRFAVPQVARRATGTVELPNSRCGCADVEGLRRCRDAARGAEAITASEPEGLERRFPGRGEGIRTPGTLTGTTDFKTDLGVANGRKPLDFRGFGETETTVRDDGPLSGPNGVMARVLGKALVELLEGDADGAGAAMAPRVVVDW